MSITASERVWAIPHVRQKILTSCSDTDLIHSLSFVNRAYGREAGLVRFRHIRRIWHDPRIFPDTLPKSEHLTPARRKMYCRGIEHITFIIPAGRRRWNDVGDNGALDLVNSTRVAEIRVECPNLRLISLKDERTDLTTEILLRTAHIRRRYLYALKHPERAAVTRLPSYYFKAEHWPGYTVSVELKVLDKACSRIGSLVLPRTPLSQWADWLRKLPLPVTGFRMGACMVHEFEKEELDVCSIVSALGDRNAAGLGGLRMAEFGQYIPTRGPSNLCAALLVALGKDLREVRLVVDRSEGALRQLATHACPKLEVLHLQIIRTENNARMMSKWERRRKLPADREHPSLYQVEISIDKPLSFFGCKVAHSQKIRRQVISQCVEGLALLGSSTCTYTFVGGQQQRKRFFLERFLTEETTDINRLIRGADSAEITADTVLKRIEQDLESKFILRYWSGFSMTA